MASETAAPADGEGSTPATEMTSDPASAPPSPPPTALPTDAEVAVLAEDLGRAEGFGAAATGGAGGEVYWVTTLADNGPGSLRSGAEDTRPLWIRFAVSGEIVMGPPLRVASHKTIDGRGADVTLSGHSLELDGVENVIITNLRFGEARRGAGRDVITMIRGAHDLWVNHCTFTDSPDELVSIAGGATDITVSWSHFQNAGKAMLVGSRESREVDMDTRVTVHHNWFDRTRERNPRVTQAWLHAYNNVVEGWRNHGMSAIRGARLLSEANVFIADGDTRALIAEGAARDNEPGFTRAEGDLLLGGAEVVEREPQEVPDPPYDVQPEPATPALTERVTAGAGWQPG